MQTEPSVGELENFCIIADVMMLITRRKIKGLVAVKFGRVYAGRTQAEVQTQIKENHVEILQLSKGAASNRIRTRSVRFLETISIKIFSGIAADDVML